MDFFTVVLLCAAVIQCEVTATTYSLKDPYPLPHRFSPAGRVGRRDATCQPNSEDYEQKTEALTCEEEYLKAVDEEIQQSNCKNTQYVDNDNDYDDGNSSEVTCDGPSDEREGVPNCSETCSLRQFYYLYCTYLGEQNAEIGRECGQPWEGAGFCSYVNGDFLLVSVLLHDLCHQHLLPQFFWRWTRV